MENRTENIHHSNAHFAAPHALKELNSLRAPFSLPDLPYSYVGLEPLMDEETVRVHHDKHHQSYVNHLNEAVEGQNVIDLGTLITTVSTRGEAIRHHGGGHWNHSFFWTIMTDDESKREMSQRLERELIQEFGSINAFKAEFEKEGQGVFGSGWVWLIRDQAQRLAITCTPNQDNPLMDVAKMKGTPLLCADVWEHAYYLKYKNHRESFLKNFWGLVNWQQVEAYDHAAN